jgi:hypothetical protein
MSENSSADIWQIDVNGQIYEAPFDEMAQWIAEGSLLRGDMVRKGSLRWIEAGRVPTLIQFFNAREAGTPILPVVTVGDDNPQTSNFQPAAEIHLPATPSFEPAAPLFSSFEPEIPVETQPDFNPPPPQPPPVLQPGMCVMHSDIPAVYQCDTCGNGFCKACPNSYGGTVKICPFCGAMCRSIEAAQAAAQVNYRHEEALAEGFGLADFGRALAYPFKFKISYVFGAVMFAFFSYGQSAASMGGFMLTVASIFCLMGTNMLTFGILSNTVDNFSQGRIGGNFMPAFDGFSIWEDVVHPFFMSIAVYIVSFGLLAVLVIGAIWYFMGSLLTAADKLQETSVSTILPGSQGDLNSARQVPQIKQFREQLNKQNPYANGQMPTDEDIIRQQSATGHDTEDMVMQAQETIQKTRKAQTEAMIGKAPDEEKAQYGQMARELAGKASLFMIPIALAFLWGIFYFPAACAVAGYTGSFSATLNPFVGLDTIKRLGFSYVKILLMCLLILIISGAASVVLAVIFSPFDLPRMGNIPAKIVESFIAFYFSIVFSCTLGFALYKNSDKLSLLRA